VSASLPIALQTDCVPFSGAEKHTALITLGASLLWLPDAFHHWHPVIPALLGGAYCGTTVLGHGGCALAPQPRAI